MHSEYTTDTSICQAGNVFSLDESIKKWADTHFIPPQNGKWCHSMEQYINQAVMI